MRKDLRARLQTKTGYDLPFLGPGSILKSKRGIIFPFTPTISVQTQVEYNQYSLPHTNYQQSSYTRTPNTQIQISGRFIQQTKDECKYFIAVQHFFRVVTKMHFGINDPLRGTPPPVLLFSCYGEYNFNRIPVLVSGLSINYPDNVDYLEVDIESKDEKNRVVGNSINHVPSDAIIALDITIQQNPDKIRREFNLQDFASGKLYNQGFI